MRVLALGLLAALAIAGDAVEGRVKWEQARLALEKKDAAGALAKFEEALRELPAEPLLLYEAAKCAFDLKEIDKAATWIEKAIRTENAAFKERPEYDQAVKLAAKVRDAREAASGSAGREIAAEKAYEVVEAALVAVSGDPAEFFARYYRKRLGEADSSGAFASPGEIFYDRLGDEWASPHVSASGQSSPPDEWTPEGSTTCDIVFEFETEKSADGFANRVTDAAKKQLPSWKKKATKMGGVVAYEGKKKWEPWTIPTLNMPTRARWRQVVRYVRKVEGRSHVQLLRVSICEHEAKAGGGSSYNVYVEFGWEGGG